MWQQPFDAYKAKSTFSLPNFRFADEGELPVSNGVVAAAGSFGLGGGSTAGFQATGGPLLTTAPVQQQSSTWLGTGVGAGSLLPGQNDGSGYDGAPGNPGSTYSGAIVQVVVPLSWMALFSGSSYLPPFATSNIMLKLYTNQIQRIFNVYNTNSTTVATINGGAGTNIAFAEGPAILSVNLNNVRLSYDAVIVSPAVEDAMLSMLNAGGKIYYPVIHHRVQNDICNMDGPQGGPKQFLLNCATSNLISLYQFFLKDTQLTSLNDPLTYMPNVGFGSLSDSASNRYYVQIGSKTFPSVSQVVGAG